MCLSIARLVQHRQDQQELFYLLSFVICAKAAITTNTILTEVAIMVTSMELAKDNSEKYQIDFTV